MTIRRAVRAAASFAGALLFLAGATGLARGQAEPFPFKLLAEQLVALFPEVLADVIEVQGGTVTISVGRRGGLQPGVQMVLFREGRELRHPKSGEFLGRVEERLGRVVVDETFDAYSTASVIEGSGARPGDRARVPAGKITLTVLKLVSGLKEDLAEAAVRAVVEELGRTGRFQVEFGDRVSVWLPQRAVTDQEFLAGTAVREALERFQIAHLLLLRFSKIGKRPYMEVRLFSGLRAEPVLTTALFVPASVKPSAARQYSSAADARTPPPRAQQGSLLARMLGWERDPGTYSAGAESMPIREVARFGFAVRTMDVAVAPADGIARLVLTDGSRIFLYRIVGQTLEPEWTYEQRSVGRILSLQLADLDGDGSLEVVVNRQDPGVGMLSQVISARNGRPEAVVQEIPLILLAVDETGEGVKRGLWGQMYSRGKLFTPGHAERLVLKDGELTSAGRVPVPDAFRATGATLSNIADKSLRALVFVDAEQRLQIAVNGEERWRSTIAVGGGYTLGEIQEALSDGMIISRFFKMEPSPAAVDLDQDGVEEIVVPVNEGESGVLAVVFRGPAGYRIQVVNSGFQGAITSIGPIPGEGASSLVASLVRFTGFLQSSGETQIIMTTPE